jgi:hypothetical protein
MPLVETWSEDELDVEGRYTARLGGPTPLWTVTTTPCPFCGEALQRMTNAADVGVHRVARILRKGEGRWWFIGDQLNARTHHLLKCGACKMGFSALMGDRK